VQSFICERQRQYDGSAVQGLSNNKISPPPWISVRQQATNERK
jgi:hypothetical protein